MRVHVWGVRAWCVGLMLLLANVGQAAEDTRLVDAAERRDTQGVVSLLDQDVDANVAQVDGATALHWAAHWDDVEIARLLLRAGAHVNAANDHGVTPLSLGSQNGSPSMVEALLKAGADANAAERTGETALLTAARTGNPNVVTLLLAHGADVDAGTHESGQTALMWAISEHHLAVAQTLIEHGADVHAQSTGGFTPLLFAAREGQVEAARSLVAKGVGVNESAPDGTHPLLMAINSRQLAFARFLLENGADPNAETGGNTALHAAVTSGLSQRRYSLEGTEPSGKAELVRELTARGADVNAQAGARRGRVTIGRSVVEGATDPYTFGVGSRRLATPFWLAADAAKVELMRVLLEAGADPHLATEDGSTALMVAAGLGHTGDARRREGWTASRAVEAVDLLLELGADVNATNEAGFTALHGTAFPGATAVVPLLVSQGADLNAQEFRGRTAYRIAQGHKGSGMIFQEWPETAALLTELGTDVGLGVDPRIAEREGGLAASLAVSAAGNDPTVDPTLHQIMVESAAFENGASIPSDYATDGRNISPPLGWDELPAATKALAVVAEDPDAATLLPFVHWVIYNIPPTARGLPEAIPPGVTQTEGPVAGAIQGLTGFERGGARYMGPAPPPGERHRYRFAVYALDADLNLSPGLNKVNLLEAIQEHLIGYGEIVGTYARSPVVVEGARR